VIVVDVVMTIKVVNIAESFVGFIAKIITKYKTGDFRTIICPVVIVTIKTLIFAIKATKYAIIIKIITITITIIIAIIITIIIIAIAIIIAIIIIIMVVIAIVIIIIVIIKAIAIFINIMSS
jgi:hypothetical protein